MTKLYDTDKSAAKAHENHIPLVDVRPAEMYKDGHIPGAVNIPLADMETADVKPGSYLYCMTGYHAGLARYILAKRGINATDIGGMEFYTGPIEK